MFSSLQNGLKAGALLLAVLLGLQASFLLAHGAHAISLWSDAALNAQNELTKTLGTAREALLAAQAVLVSARGTTEQVRRSAEYQLGYYEAVGRRTSNLLAETTFLVRKAEERMKEISSASTEFLRKEAALTEEMAEDLGRVAVQAEGTLAESERLLAELRGAAASPEVRGSLAAIEASTKNLEAITAEAAVASRNTAEASGYVRDMLSPTPKSFWRRLLELFIR